MVNIALIGLGRGGSLILPILLEEKNITVIGIADINPNAHGLKTARESNIPITTDFMELLDKKPDIVINVTGNEEVANKLLKYKPAGTEIIDGQSAKFVWNMLERRHQAEGEVNKLLDETKELYRIGVALTSAKNLEDVLNSLMTEACRFLAAPAGSIALYDKESDLLTLKAFLGFSSEFSRVTEWEKRSGGMTDHILSKKTPTVISDFKKYPFIDNKLLIDEGIKSLVAVPLFANERIVGILYIDDVKPRDWTQREVEFLTLLGIQAAYSIEKFKLIETVSETKTYLKNVLANSADIIITTNTDGAIVEFNDGASRLLGYSKKEIAGKRAHDLWVRRDERDEILKMLEKDGYVSNYETELITKYGKIIDVSLTLSYIKNSAGKNIGTVGISKDITGQKKLKKAIEKRNMELQELNENLEKKVIERTMELKKTNIELERSNKLKSLFIANMSHELRTPLNSILGFSELLSGETFGSLTEKQKRHVNNIFTSGNHLLHLINNILDIAKVESGKMDLHYESFSIYTVISDIEIVVKSLMEKKKQSMAVTIDKNMPLIKADKIKFKQILYNLLSNAAKFTPEGGNIKLIAGMTNDGNINFLKLSVIDTGIGIKKEDHDRVFTEFEQVDSSFSRQFEGTGLGLALTRKFVELHGGEILLDSEAGKGSTFTIMIPLTDPLKTIKPAVEPEPTREEALFEADIAPNSGGNAPLILVVEDDPETSEIMTLHLAKAGYRVAHAYNGEDAIKRARELEPFAVLLDIMLPGKDGWEVLQEIKSDPKLKSIPVIMSSVVDNTELGFALGATDYLLKPVGKKVLLNKLEELSFATRKGRKHINVLCIDDNDDVLELLTSILEPVGYNVITANSGQDGIKNAINYKPDLIILDLMMPGIDGFEVAKTLKKNTLTMDIPILILTAKDLTVEDRLLLADKVEKFMQKSHFSKEDLLMHLKDLEIAYPARAGLLDDISGLFDHRYFQLRLAQEISRSERYKKSFTLLMLDLDHFTVYINKHGMRRANICIKKVAEFIKKSLRGSDTAVRYGVDEYALILSNTIIKPAEIVAKRTLSYINDYPFYGEEIMPQGCVTASISMATYPQDASTPEELIFKAHNALRQAKKGGGGKLEIYAK